MSFFEQTIHAFHEGGWGMWPILILGIFMVVLTVERTTQLYLRMNINKEDFFKYLTNHLLKGDLEGAHPPRAAWAQPCCSRFCLGPSRYPLLAQPQRRSTAPASSSSMASTSVASG